MDLSNANLYFAEVKSKDGKSFDTANLYPTLFSVLVLVEQAHSLHWIESFNN